MLQHTLPTADYGYDSNTILRISAKASRISSWDHTKASTRAYRHSTPKFDTSLT